MAVSIHFCICETLAEPLRRQLYQALVSKLLLASAIVSGFGGCYGMDPKVGSLWMVISSVSAPHFVTPSMGILFPLLRRIEVSTLWSSFFLSFMYFTNCILGILSFWVNIHLSVNIMNTCHVSCFVIGLPHSG